MKGAITMSEVCTSDCSACGQECSSRREPQDMVERTNDFSQIRKVIGVVSGKGGVGKSLVTALLASALEKSGLRTAVLDADITGPSIPKLFGITDKAMSDGTNIYPVPSKGGTEIMSVNLMLNNDTDPVVWRGPVIAGVVKQFWSDVVWGDIDVMLVDMPPGTGDVPLTVFQSIPVDGIIVVTSPQDLVSMIVGKAVKMANMMNIPVLGIVQNMSYFVCPNCKEKHYIFGDSQVETFAKEYSVDTVCHLPIQPEIARMCDIGRVEDLDTSDLAEMVAAITKIKEA